jgi:GNAT superfamily N-acetyltransferase
MATDKLREIRRSKFYARSIVAIRSSDDIPNYGKHRGYSYGLGEMTGGVHLWLFDKGGFSIRDDYPLSVCDQSPSACLLCNFIVKEPYRHNGYARKLFRHAKRLAKYMGYAEMRFSCTPELQGMYESFGANVTKPRTKATTLVAMSIPLKDN